MRLLTVNGGGIAAGCCTGAAPLVCFVLFIAAQALAACDATVRNKTPA